MNFDITRFTTTKCEYLGKKRKTITLLHLMTSVGPSNTKLKYVPSILVASNPADSSSSIASGPSSSPTNFRCACNTGYSLALDGRHCVRSPECGHVRVDVVFVLDTSNSVSHQSYKNALGVVVEFVRFIQRVSLVCHRRISS